MLTGRLAGVSRRVFPLRLKATAGAAAGVHLVSFDVTLDGQRYGEWFDLIVDVESVPAAMPAGN